MIASRLSRLALPLWLAVGLAVACGCSNKKPKGRSTPSASAAASASAGPKPSGPCADYSARLCAAAGSESPACQAVKSTSEILSPAACKAALKDVDYSIQQLSKQRKVCDELVKKLCAEVGEKTQTCTMVATQTKQFPAERCAMMLDHLGEIVADLKKMEQGNAPLTPELQAALTEGSPPAFGPANAKVTVVEFSDFQCPYCVQASTVVHQIREKYPKDVRFVFRQFPLSMHPDAHLAAQAALAAHAQGKFWQYHDLLFKNPNDLGRPSLERYAKQIGLDVAAFNKALDEKTYAVAVDRDLKLGEQVQVQGTPSMFVNGERVGNPGNFDAVASQIDAALEGPKAH